MALKELDRTRYKDKVENPKETVYEVITTKDGLGWGMAIADIGRSELHWHEETMEVYLVVEGTLEVTIDEGMEERVHYLNRGQMVLIQPGFEHKARTLGPDPARIVAFTFPAWTLEDHHLVSEESSG